MKTIISIITPVYKAEKYIHRCVDSILAQTFTDFELILIDDGSPDGSGVICDEYAAKDPRVKVIHKVNGGVAMARQDGMENAVGEYTIHADPDDWVEPTMLEELYGKAVEEGADMVICDYYMCRRKKCHYISQTPSSLESGSLFREYLGQKLHGSLCNKLIKRELYTKNNISFHPEITRWEDLYIVCSILSHPVKVAYLQKAFYYYDQDTNPHSIVRSKSNRGLLSQMCFINHFQEMLPAEEFAEELYQIKAATKELAYNSGAMAPDEVMQLYSEVNERYIETVDRTDLRRLCFSRFLSGRYSYNQAKRVRRRLDLWRKIKKLFR